MTGKPYLIFRILTHSRIQPKSMRFSVRIKISGCFSFVIRLNCLTAIL